MKINLGVFCPKYFFSLGCQSDEVSDIFWIIEDTKYSNASTYFFLKEEVTSFKVFSRGIFANLSQSCAYHRIVI